MTRYLLALIVASLTLVVPSAASADWLPIEELGGIQASDQEMRLASNDRGDTVALWRDSRGIQVAVSRRGGAFGNARKVPGSAGGYAADVILNEDGRAIVYWRKFVTEFTQRVEIVGLKVDGGFGKPRPVTPTDQYITFDPVIGPGGRFAFIYTVGGRMRPVYARVAPPSGRLGRRITLATGSIQRHDLWYLGGRPMIAYTQASDDYTRLRERQIGSGGSRVLANLPKDSAVALDTASNGMQVAYWSNAGTDSRAKHPLTVATRRPAATFGKGQVLETRIPPQELGVAIAPSGAATIAWREWNESGTEDGESPTPEYTPGNIITSFRPAGGSFGALRTFRPDPERTLIEGLSVDINSAGTAVLSFGATRFVGILHRMFTAIQRRGGEPEATPMTDFNEGGGPAAQIDEKGRTAVEWTSDRRVHARRGSFR